MKVNYPYLNDDNFLDTIDTMHHLEQYVKITALDWKEKPIRDIEGIITSGSMNIDGHSAIRRTISLSSSFGTEITNIDNIFSLNRKINVQIGFKNNTNQYKDYPIIWFPQGVFIIISANVSHSLSGTSVSLQARDKMSLLNGDFGG